MLLSLAKSARLRAAAIIAPAGRFGKDLLPAPDLRSGWIRDLAALQPQGAGHGPAWNVERLQRSWILCQPCRSVVHFCRPASQGRQALSGPTKRRRIPNHVEATGTLWLPLCCSTVLARSLVPLLLFTMGIGSFLLARIEEYVRKLKL